MDPPLSEGPFIRRRFRFMITCGPSDRIVASSRGARFKTPLAADFVKGGVHHLNADPDL